MTSTEDLIEHLAATARPVRRLRPPVVRCALWLGFAGLIVFMLGLSRGVRPDLTERLGDGLFVLRLTSASTTGVLAALAVFLVGLPDRSGRWALLPVPGLILWLSTIGYGCFTDWVPVEPDGVRLAQALSCVATLILTSTPLSLAIYIMIRRMGPLRPSVVTFCAALSVSGITATALTLFHTLDASLLIIFWNLGVAILFVGMGSLFGKRLHA